MSSTIKYHSVTAENDKDAGFQEYDTVDFVLTGEGRKLVKNSVLLSYDLEVNSAANTPKTTGDQIRYNHKIGGHSFFESFQLLRIYSHIQFSVIKWQVLLYPKMIIIL